MNPWKLPGVGDEVAYDPERLAVVTDIRKGVFYLRRPGVKEWPVNDPASLTVRRTRVERIAAGDFQ
ncbi:hypothetical protein HEK616_05830 [Streptomyces nigrescens]|uniref:Transposase n=2 Tax=Streptomyces TaxID=1883 RepID=A0ABM7ZLZ3_STRNI|nr:hypothetical protein [Streptomyces nigrescens]MEE4424900.1 hypothetical protein [Streptomyces sp. DSM 41528]BDM67096.1 hypothetical protein HEK616_05830 [Streptomyces nigrescens]